LFANKPNAAAYLGCFLIPKVENLPLYFGPEADGNIENSTQEAGFTAKNNF
jgi:hypothetical protein